MIDLHVHSTYSDGTSSVEDIIDQAVKLGLSQIAITDHNILTGSIKANEISPINTVIGTELSVGYNNEELHLLGYFPNGSDYKNVEFVIRTGEINKKLAIAEMIERLNDQGYDITINELSEFAGGIINRVHICRVLMKHGYIETVAEGFERLVGDNCPAYVEREYVSIEEACEAIHNDGGITVLAHPYNYKKIKNIPKLLDDVKDLLDGIECYHPSATPENSEYLVQFAKEHNKIITGGSDYHGDNKPRITLNMMQVDDKFMIENKMRKSN